MANQPNITLTEDQFRRLVAQALNSNTTDIAVAIIKEGLKGQKEKKEERDVPVIPTDREPILTIIHCDDCKAPVFKDDSATILDTKFRAVLRTPRHNKPTEYWGDFPLLTRPAYDNYNNLKTMGHIFVNRKTVKVCHHSGEYQYLKQFYKDNEQVHKQDPASVLSTNVDGEQMVAKKTQYRDTDSMYKAVGGVLQWCILDHIIRYIAVSVQ